MLGQTVTAQQSSEMWFVILIVVALNFQFAYSEPPVCGRPLCSACPANKVILPQIAGECPTCDLCLSCPLRKCSGCPEGVTPKATKDRNGCNGCPICETDLCPVYRCKGDDCPDGSVLIETVGKNSCPGCFVCSCVKPTCNKCPDGLDYDPIVQLDGNGCAVCPECIAVI